MKSTVEALQLRDRLIQNFEDFLLTKDSKEFQRLLDIVVAGGGPTGVEVSGALAEMRKYVLPKDYPELDFSQMDIYLLEGAERGPAYVEAAHPGLFCVDYLDAAAPVPDLRRKKPDVYFYKLVLYLPDL